MTKKEAREELASEFIQHIVEYGERAMPDEAYRLERIDNALRTLGIYGAYPGMSRMIQKQLEDARIFEAL
jgi:hypothetical protein